MKIYGNTFALLEHIPKAECWNLSKDNLFTLAKGWKIKVLRIYDSYHTTVQLLGDHGEAINHPANRSAYRFIINNIVLSDAIGGYIPTKTTDPIGDLITQES